ncbi:MAG: metal transporter [Chloroflexota bacterium]|jgi:zinc transporter ZupT|nr:metal transporter [Anaerolineales bacterium]MBI4760465.1 metal transporter [Chloroflexota bacterium]MBI5704996.1 metal transporter [Chloroflexota bacterium]NJC95709.1 metal transporter [Anaerolineae bacterium]RJP47046.1 MAG: metal transporter [Anaerolineaceae bacterium]
MTQSPSNRFTFRTFILLLIPIILLVGVIVLFLSTGGGLNLDSAAPVENLDIERYVLKQGSIELQVRNTSPEEITIAQVIVNDAVMPFEVYPDAVVPRLERATITIAYPWSYGEAYGLIIFTGNAIPFTVDIPVAFETPQPDTATFWGFTLIGLYVGVIPVFLGIFWFPALRQMGRRTMTFLMAATAGLLVFLGLDTVAEALEFAGKIPSSFQGIGLIGIGGVATFLLLEAISKRQSEITGNEADKRLAIAFVIAVGIGIHNLGEGLAIGAAYNVGEIALGTFLVVGFIIQNITEGLGIIAPVLRDRPGVGRLAIMGLVGGAPAILGAWIGGYTPSPFLTVLFLAIGAGAIFQVIYEIAKLIQKDTQREAMPMIVFSGVLTGMMMLWVTGLLIK